MTRITPVDVREMGADLSDVFVPDARESSTKLEIQDKLLALATQREYYEECGPDLDEE